MKRGLSTSDDRPGSARRPRRQPQTSCDFCRSKKLKCDRALPCGNCVVRHQTCYILGEPSVANDQVSIGNSMGGDLSERIRRLEEVVYSLERQEKDGSSPASPSDQRHARLGSTKRSSAPKTRFPLHVARCSKNPWLGLEYTIVNDSLVSDHVDKITFRVASGCFLGDGTRSGTSETTVADSQGSSQSILLPSKHDMLALVEDYINDPSHLLHIIHAPSTRALVSDVYTRLSHGQQVRNGEVALMLSIAASSAFLWDGRMDVKYTFDSHEDAAYRSRMWRKAAWDLQDQSIRATSGSLQDVHARMVLAELIYNMEGCSPRFRCLQSAALAVAREISLHLIDASDRRHCELLDAMEDVTLREIKRRTWWHLASTDWLLSTMGGPQDRTYSVHPQHMQVNYPRNITDDALMACQEAEPPPGPLDLAGCPTDMLFLIRRIRLAEISRATADALPLGSDVDEMAYDKCLELYSAFEAALGSFSTATEQNSVPYRLVFQHHILLLAAHARCARLFRRFLHLPEAGSPEASQHDERFRLACRRSARAVLETALVLLQDSLEREAFGAEVIQVIPYAHRSGCIINHLFMACTLLATDPALAPTESGFGGGTAAEETRALLMRSCRLLERVSEASAMAASMVHSLVGVFRRHGIRPTEVEGRYNSAPTTDALQYLDHQTQQPLAAPGGHTLPAPESPIAVANPDHEASDMGLVEIWDDLMNSSATPTSNRWNQLFLDLDILGGSVEI